jgi:hypothetical protein
MAASNIPSSARRMNVWATGLNLAYIRHAGNMRSSPNPHLISCTNGPLYRSAGRMARISITSLRGPKVDVPSSLSPRKPASLTMITHGDTLLAGISMKVRKVSCTATCTRGCNTFGMSSRRMSCRVFGRELSAECSEDATAGEGEDAKTLEQDEARLKKLRNLFVKVSGRSSNASSSDSSNQCLRQYILEREGTPSSWRSTCDLGASRELCHSKTWKPSSSAKARTTDVFPAPAGPVRARMRCTATQG